MFGNLKNKLVEVTDLKKFSTPQVLSSLTTSQQQSVGQSPGSDTPVRLKHSRQSSNASQNGLLNISNHNSLPYKNMKEKELQNEISKLKVSMEQQQIKLKENFSMKELELLARLQEQEQKASTIERQFINIRENEKVLYKQLKEMESFVSEKSHLSTQYEAKLRGTENQLEILQENYDQLEGLGTQEVAKVKHLLLDTSNQLSNVNDELDLRTTKLGKLSRELEIANVTVCKYNSLVEEKMELDTTVAGLRQKLNVVNLRVVTIEKENEDKMQCLEEKISVLENRNKQCSLEDDDRINALVEEREALDHLLEEKRQELSNIKMSWSEKICNLERKIQNLNEKMADDQIEINKLEETNDSLTIEVDEMKGSYESYQDKCMKEVTTGKLMISQLEEDLETMKWKNEEAIKTKEKETKEARKNIHMKEEELMQLKEISELKENKLMEYEDVYNELEDTKIKFITLQDEYKILKSSHESFVNSHSAEKEKCQRLGSELTIIKSKYETALGEKLKLSSNLDELSDKIISLESQLISSSDEIILLKKKHSDLEQEKEEYRNKYVQSKNLMKEVESNFEPKILESDLFKSLELKCKSMEDELVDTKQKFKVQKQRMEDMKKTIQKELRISPSYVDRSSEKNNVNNKERIIGINDKFPNYSTFPGADSEFINIPYLKHVLLKFMTSRESEAIQLVRAIGELLHMTKSEEKLLSETMRWKMSWFGSKPNLGRGQEAKAIPPSQ